MSETADIRVERAELPALVALEAEWRALENRSGSSFFQSWSWIGTWLECLPPEVPRWLLRAWRGQAIVGLAILCESTVRRHGLLSSRALFLHCTGRPDLDELTVEYNGFLAEQGLEAQVTRQCVEFLRAEQGWDEVFLNAWHPPELLPSLATNVLQPVTIARQPCYFVALQKLRQSGRDYAEGLSSTTRHNLRRSQREYGKLGPLQFEVAASLPDALVLLAELKQLHQQSWEAKGQPGSFANSFFDSFHRKLVQRQYSAGVIQLARMQAGGQLIGCLYNFVYRGHVYQYQSGLDFGINSRLSPGLVCHAAAVGFNLAAGHAVYDFLAGGYRYKKELASDATEMHWLVLQQPRLKFQIERWLRAGKARLRGLGGAPGNA